MVGGGSWATALVKILNESNHQVNWWLRGQQAVDHLLKKHHNSHYLSSVSFSPGLISPTNDLREVIRVNDILFLAVPATFLPEVLENFLPEDFQDKIIVSAIKGMIPDKNQIIAAYLYQHLGIPFEKIVIISGPCHAEEVALEKLSYLTLACPDEAVALSICELLRCNYLRCISSDDIYGTEYGAVLKNIYALAAGICHGLGYGDNFQAVLISNAIEEMECFVKAVHPISRDIKNSAYLGDLLVTAYSQFSRNRTLGTMIGKGYSVKTALLETNMVAEGYNAAKCIHEVNKQYHVPLLISEATYRILYKGVSARDEMQKVSEKLS
ncbi:MAG: NAD(P)-binding domain-containing protein [Chitinophagales bacterium]|jgi:glycerol-3-phosphate dehydrogenase (NAD(P)+)|nr:NAD(P)-binding domain-containing protein [Chitinophagales bacterium]